jgi:hypothetical protein
LCEECFRKRTEAKEAKPESATTDCSAAGGGTNATKTGRSAAGGGTNATKTGRSADREPLQTVAEVIAHCRLLSKACESLNERYHYAFDLGEILDDVADSLDTIEERRRSTGCA